MNETKPSLAGRDRRHRDHPLQRAAPWRACRATPCCRGRTRTNTRPGRVRSSPSTRRRGRPRSIWSRNWPAFFGASAGCAWPRPPPIGTGWKIRFANRGGLRRRRWCILTLPTRSEDVADAIRATAADTEDDIRDMQEDEAMTRRALDLLGSRRNDPYEAALGGAARGHAAMVGRHASPRPRRAGRGRGAAHRRPPRACAAFSRARCCRGSRRARRNWPTARLIREQAFGESLDPDKLERLGRYEVHLDRKFERMLSMLLRLKDLRQGAIAG